MINISPLPSLCKLHTFENCQPLLCIARTSGPSIWQSKTLHVKVKFVEQGWVVTSQLVWLMLCCLTVSIRLATDNKDGSLKLCNPPLSSKIYVYFYSVPRRQYLNKYYSCSVDHMAVNKFLVKTCFWARYCVGEGIIGWWCPKHTFTNTCTSVYGAFIGHK